MPEQAMTHEDYVVQYMGFEKCEFGPDSDPCESCKKPDLQLYFMGIPGDGTYYCLDCIMAEYDANQKALAECERLEGEGHTSHCAARHVWGDGECECQKQGIIPGSVSRMIVESC